MNQEYVERRRGMSADELLSQLHETRRKTLELIERASDDELAKPVPGAPWADGTVGGVLQTGAGHGRMHLNWLNEGLQAPVSG